MAIAQIDAQSRSQFEYWRLRTFYSIFLGYIFYYFTRKSFTFAMPALISDMGFDKSDLGILVTVFSVTYGISKFVSGIFGDKSNPRYFMGIGLILTGIFNICFGASSSLWLFIIFWGLNSWFQGFGWPPCARMLAYWYSSRTRGTWWAIHSTSHNIGGAIIPVLAALCLQYFNWRYALYIPGIMCIFMGFWLMERLRDTPYALGLPSAERIDGVKDIIKHPEKKKLTTKEILFNYVLCNKYIWLLGLANFFVYIVRTGFNDWIMLYLSEERGLSVFEAGVSVPWFEAGGIVGMLLAGWCSDKLFNGNRGIISLVFMIILIIPTALFWLYPGSYIIVAALMFFIGLFIFGPQMLIGCAAAEKSHQDAAATASGFAGTFGYLGAACAGYPFGLLLDHYGWDSFFIAMLIAAFLGALCFVPFIALKWGRAAEESLDPVL
jgi:OPA family sugar phosphate sensor protein UhpC-like MFS transporter